MMTAKKDRVPSSPEPVTEPTPAQISLRRTALGLALALALTGLILIFLTTTSLMDLTAIFPLPATVSTKSASTPPSSGQPAKPETRLTREGIDHLLDTLDQAIRRKDVEGVLRHIAPGATITIHMRQGSQQQSTTLTRDEYRTTLRMGFAFPSANDYARVGTTVSLAPDERSAKVSFKTAETLRHARRDLKVEGEEALVFKVLDDRPVIVSLEQVVPGDST